MKKVLFILLGAMCLLMTGCKKSPEKMAAEANATYMKENDKCLDQMESLADRINPTNMDELSAEMEEIQDRYQQVSEDWLAGCQAAAVKAFGVANEEELATLSTEETAEWIQANIETPELIEYIEKSQQRAEEISMKLLTNAYGGMENLQRAFEEMAADSTLGADPMMME